MPHFDARSEKGACFSAAGIAQERVKRLDDVGGCARAGEVSFDVDVEHGFEVGEPTIRDNTEDRDERLEDEVVDFTSLIPRRVENAKQGVEDDPARK